MSVLRKSLIIKNERGLHARASAKFVNAVSLLPQDIDVRIAREGNEASGGSILGLMMLGAAKGDTVELIVSGDRVESIFDNLCGMIENGFGEE